MKKILLAAIAVGLMSSSAMALVEGTVDTIWIKSDKTIVYVGTHACSLGIDDRAKTFLATLLTAQASGQTVKVNMGGGNCQAVFILKGQ